MKEVRDFIRQSLAIEGIHREPTEAEIMEWFRFMDLEEVTIADLEQFISVYQPTTAYDDGCPTVLRDQEGMDVSIGGKWAPRGGPRIRVALEALLEAMAEYAGDPESAWRAHIEYEHLHPFLDGNGRSGRMLWCWMMGDAPTLSLSFLQAFYYETLQYTKNPINGWIRTPDPKS